MVVNWKFVLKVVGFIIIIESLFLFLTAGVAAYYHSDDTMPLVYSACISLVAGCILVLACGIRKKIHFIGRKEGFVSVTLSWILFALFGSLPFLFSGVVPHFTDAFFESMSGITTTGSSVMTNIDAMPKGILFWRSVLQWLGGMGIIVFSLALLPLMGGEAAQLFDAESSGLTHDKFRPRVAQMAKRLWLLYLFLTFCIIGLLYLGPMDVFDSVCHGLTTISTGGYSTKQASISHWDSMYVEGVMIVFMILGAINFPLLYLLFTKGSVRKFLKDEELRWFLSIIAIAALLIAIGLFFGKGLSWLTVVRQSVFQVVSLITTSSFFTADYSGWGAFYLIVFLFLMVVCGCASSTSGGLKTVRALVLVKNTIHEFERLVHPRAILPVRLNGKALSFGVVQRLLAFAFLYISIIFASWAILTGLGLPFIDALSAAVSAIGNSGAGFGALGPSGSYAGIPEVAKWYLAFLMVVGRLEVFTVLMLFTPGFWRR
jgi:trk system potassium uptake protein TrkH